MQTGAASQNGETVAKPRECQWLGKKGFSREGREEERSDEGKVVYLESRNSGTEGKGRPGA